MYFSSFKNSLHLFLICSITKSVTFSRLLLCGVHKPNTVKRILQNVTYLGWVSNGNTKKINYKSKKTMIMPKEIPFACIHFLFVQLDCVNLYYQLLYYLVLFDISLPFQTFLIFRNCRKWTH